MLTERLLSAVVREATKDYLKINPTTDTHVPAAEPGKRYMLYAHVPFCERLCPYCSFNRFPFREDRTRAYFDSLRKEMRMLKDLGYDFDSLYVGGGTPTIMIDELCETIDLARDLFSIKEVSSETNPNHLIPEYLDKLKGRVQRLSVGVQSFDDGLLKQMDRYDKYGSGDEIVARVQEAVPYFISMNVDMIFNFPAQTEDMLIRDIERIVETGATQTTFYPLMASPAVEKSMARTVGRVSYDREQRYYQIVDEILAGGDAPLFSRSSAWTYNRITPAAGEEPASTPQGKHAAPIENLQVKDNETGMIDEYVVQYEEYPAIGSGGITYLGNSLYVNTFSLSQYHDAIESGHMSIMGKTEFNLHDRMRYRFLMQTFGLRLDKKRFKKDFGMSVEDGLPVEMAFMKLAGAFDVNNDEEVTLTPRGRYLAVVMMRQFFIGVNNLRDQARSVLPKDERELLFGAGCAMADPDAGLEASMRKAAAVRAES
jgi:coproporphyrinogen III oxidase-like Fe-S oxidoreductase